MIGQSGWTSKAKNILHIANPAAKRKGGGNDANI